MLNKPGSVLFCVIDPQPSSRVDGHDAPDSASFIAELIALSDGFIHGLQSFLDGSQSLLIDPLGL
ncbi:MAG: hypothetical protein ABT940_08400, partial [Alphaproteobacteria bacterium]